MTRFIPVAADRDAVADLMRRGNVPLCLASTHGLGDNIFASPCFEPLSRLFPRLYFLSEVNAYASVFHESRLVKVLYAGGTNCNDLALTTSESFAAQLTRLRVSLPEEEVYVYSFGLFEPHLPSSDPRAYVKGRRSMIEFFGDGPDSTIVPRYHVAPDSLTGPYVNGVLDRWLEGRELIAIARYGHTDRGKNFGDDHQAVVALIDHIDGASRGRYRFISLDYSPSSITAEGHHSSTRSVYGFLPCDSSAMWHVLNRATLLVTVPTGAMLVGATCPRLRMLTLWKRASPYRFLDPQSGPVWALVQNASLASHEFTRGWTEAQRDAMLSRWHVTTGDVTPQSVGALALRILAGEA